MQSSKQPKSQTKAWLETLSTSYPPKFTTVNILDHTSTNLSLVCPQSNTFKNKDAYYVADQKLLAYSTIQEHDDLLNMEYCNSPELVRYLQGNKNNGWVKIGSNILIDCDPLRNVKQAPVSQMSEIINFYGYQLQELLSNSQEQVKYIALMGSNAMPHQNIYSLLQYLKANKQLWPYKFSITNLYMILQKLLSGVYLQLKLGYLMDNKHSRRTEYIHIKPFIPCISAYSSEIPSFIADTIFNNSHFCKEYGAPPPLHPTKDEKSLNQMIKCLLGIGMQVNQINNLMGILSSIANLRGMTVIEENVYSQNSTECYPVYRFVDLYKNSTRKQIKQTKGCLQRFCRNANLSQQTFRQLILTQKSQQSQMNTIVTAKIRLRIIQSILYHRFVDYLCNLINKKLSSKKAIQELSSLFAFNSYYHSNSKHTEKSIHKTLVIFSMLRKEQAASQQLHPQLVALKYCCRGYQSLQKDLLILAKISFIKNITYMNRVQPPPIIVKTDIEQYLTLQEFLNVRQRIQFIRQISLLSGESWMDQGSLGQQIYINNLYRQFSNYPILDEITLSIFNEIPSKQIFNTPSYIQNILWKNAPVDKNLFQELLEQFNSSSKNEPSHIYQALLAKKLDKFQTKVKSAFIITNNSLLNDYQLIQQVSKAIAYKQQDSKQSQNQSTVMPLKQFADRYKYTDYCRQQVHQKYITMKELKKKSKIYKHSFYQDNQTVTDQLSKKILECYLQEEPIMYIIRDQETREKNKMKKSKSEMFIVIKSVNFFEALEAGIERQNLAVIKIWAQYSVFKRRRKTLQIIKRKYREKKFVLAMSKLIDKKYYFEMIKNCAFCKALKNILNPTIKEKQQLCFERLKKNSSMHKIEHTLSNCIVNNKTAAFLLLKTIKKNYLKQKDPEKPDAEVDSLKKPINNSNDSVVSLPGKQIAPPAKNQKSLQKQPKLVPEKQKLTQDSKILPKPLTDKPKPINQKNSPKQPILSSPERQKPSVQKIKPSPQKQKKPVQSLKNSESPSKEQKKNVSTLKSNLAKKQQDKPILTKIPDLKTSQLTKRTQFIKKVQNVEEITKPELFSLDDFPNLSLQQWQKKTLIKAQKPTNIYKAVQAKHRPINLLDIPIAEDNWVIKPDFNIMNKVKLIGYMDFLKNITTSNNQPDFEKIVHHQNSQLSKPILKMYPLKQYPTAYKQTFNALLKIGSDKNSGKSLQFLYNQITSPIQASYKQYIKTRVKLTHDNSQQQEIMKAYAIHNFVKDQIFIQITKQITFNKDNNSVIKLLHCLSIITRYFYPSPELIFPYFCYYQQMHVKYKSLQQSHSIGKTDGSQKAVCSFLESIIQNLLQFIEVIQIQRGKKVAGFVYTQKKMPMDKKQIVGYLGMRKTPINYGQINVGVQKPNLQASKSLTPSKIIFSTLTTALNVVQFKPIKCVIRLLNNEAFSYFIRNQIVETMKKKVLKQIDLLNKQNCFGLYSLNNGCLYDLIDDDEQMIDHLFSENGEQKLIYLRIRNYYPFHLKDPNSCRLCYISLVSEEITYPWQFQDYEYLVIQSMLQGEYEEIRINNYLHFSNQLGQKNPNLNNIRQQYAKVSANHNKKIYELEYMKYMKSIKFFLMKCYRVKRQKSFALGIKPYEIIVFDNNKIVSSISLDRIRNAYIQGENVVLELLLQSKDKKQAPIIKKYTISQPFRQEQLFKNILHYLENKI